MASYRLLLQRFNKQIPRLFHVRIKSTLKSCVMATNNYNNIGGYMK